MKHKSIVWLASYPKSGNTWLRVFLSRILFRTENINHLSIPIYSSKSYIEQDAVIDVSELSNEELHNLRLQVFSEKAEKERVFPVKIHDVYSRILYSLPFIPYEYSKVAIYVIRNPFDVAISFSKHLGKTIDETICIMNNRAFTLASNSLRYQIQMPQVLTSWSNHVKSWTEQQDIPIHIVKYEDLLHKTYETYSKILDVCEIPYNNETIKDAVQFASFENLQKQEKLYGFEEKSVYSKSFFDTGKAFYYVRQLTPKQIDTIYNQHKEIIKKYNYEPLV